MARLWGAIGTPQVRIGIRIGFALSRAPLVQIHWEAALLPFLIRFSLESKDYKPFKERFWYKPTDVAVKPETVTPEDSSQGPGGSSYCQLVGCWFEFQC